MGKKYSQEEIFEKLKTILVDDFEIAPEKLTLDANLFEDLELDSIDAVDLAVKLQEFTEKKISPENFKQIRTVNDVVLAIEELLQCQAAKIFNYNHERGLNRHTEDNSPKNTYTNHKFMLKYNYGRYI